MADVIYDTVGCTVFIVQFELCKSVLFMGHKKRSIKRVILDS